MRQVCHALISSAKQQFQMSINRPMFRFCVFAQPLLFGFLLGMIYLEKSPIDFMQYAVIGSGLTTFWSSICFSSASDIHRERWFGTLEHIYAAPIGFKWIVLGKIIGNTLWGLFSLLLSMSVVSLVFRFPLVIKQPLWFMIGMFWMTLSMIAIAFLFSGLFTLSRNVRVYMNFFEYPVYILSGMLFPIDILPKFIQYISYVLSPTWAVKLLRGAVAGVGSEQLYPILVVLILMTFFYGFSAIWVFNRIDYKCRIDATLEVY